MTKLKGGHYTQAMKADRKSKRRRLHNQALKSKIRTLAKKVEIACISGNAEEAKELFKAAVKAWDKAAQKGVIHRNTSARKKARLSKKVGSISAPAQ